MLPAAQGKRGCAGAHGTGGCQGHPVRTPWGDPIPSLTGSTNHTSLASRSASRACRNSSTQGQLEAAKERVHTVLGAHGHGQPPAGLPQPSPHWDPSEGDRAELHRLPASSSSVPFPALLRSPCCYYLSVKSDGFPAISCRTTKVPRSLCWKP